MYASGLDVRRVGGEKRAAVGGAKAPASFIVQTAIVWLQKRAMTASSVTVLVGGFRLPGQI